MRADMGMSQIVTRSIHALTCCGLQVVLQLWSPLPGRLPHFRFRKCWYILLVTPIHQCLLISVNMITVTPLTENMPGPSATKPGDMYEHFDEVLCP